MNRSSRRPGGRRPQYSGPDALSDRDLVYLGLAPVTEHPDGSIEVHRRDLRFAPEFGGEEEPMYGYDDGYFPGGMNPGDNPTGLSAMPVREGWMDQMAWTSDELSVDAEAALDGDVDVYDDMLEPDFYNTLVAGFGSDFGAEDFGAPRSGVGGENFGAAFGGYADPGVVGTLAEAFGGSFGQRPSSRAVAPTRLAPSGYSTRPMPMQLQRSPQVQQAVRSSAGKWMKTVLVGNVTGLGTAAAAWNIAIRPQYDFVAQDFTFTGTTGAATLGLVTVTSIIFGDHVVLNIPAGLPIAVVAVGGFIRGLIKGAKIRGGLDITIQGNKGVGGTGGTIACTVVGLKPQDTCAQV